VWTPECEEIENQSERDQCEGIMAGYNKSLQSAATTTTKAPTPKPTTTAKPTPNLLFSQTSGGNKSVRPFDAPDEWRLVWSYDCKNFAAYGGGNFIVDDEGGSGVAVNELGKGGSGTEYIDAGGRIKLQVVSTCSRWTLKAYAP
jgi:hypothetical protein